MKRMQRLVLWIRTPSSLMPVPVIFGISPPACRLAQGRLYLSVHANFSSPEDLHSNGGGLVPKPVGDATGLARHSLRRYCLNSVGHACWECFVTEMALGKGLFGQANNDTHATKPNEAASSAPCKRKTIINHTEYVTCSKILIPQKRIM